MNVLLDADVLVDLALDRSPYALPAGELLDGLERRPGSAFVAWNSISNFYYLVAPRRGAASTRAFIQDLMRFVEVAPTTPQSLAG